MGLIPEEIISRVIDSTDIVQTITPYVPLKRAGRNYKANCPFHNEKTASFVVNPTKQIFHCFGCGVGGNAISFVMKHEHLSFPEAIRLLADKVNITVPDVHDDGGVENNIRQEIFKVNKLAMFYFNTVLISEEDNNAKSAREYLKERGFSFETVQSFQLGFSLDKWDGLIKFLKEQDIPMQLMEEAGLIIARESGEGYYDRFRGRVMFPIMDIRGRCIAVGARALDDNSVKYLNSPETKVYTKGHHLYGFNLAKQAVAQEDFIIIVEGYVDCIMPYQVGIHNIVASLGTALTVDQIRLIRRHTSNVVMLYDMDKAGETAMLRSAEILIQEGMNVKIARLSDGHDPDSFIRDFGREAFQEAIKAAESLFAYKLKILKAKYQADTVEGKSKIASEMLPTIHNFSDAVKRYGYVKQLSRELGVLEKALLMEYQKIDSSFKGNQKNQNDNGPDVVVVNRSVERDLLKSLLEEDDFIAETKNNVELTDFKDTKVRFVISKIFDMFDQGIAVNTANLINTCEDQTIQNMLSGLLTDDSSMMGDKTKFHQDCILRIKTNRLNERIKEIKNKISHIEATTKDQDELLELMSEMSIRKREFNQLTKK